MDHVRVPLFIAITLAMFSLGVLAGGLVEVVRVQQVPVGTDVETPQAKTTILPPSFLWANPDVSSPADHLKESDIEVYPDKVVLKLADPQWARFTDTNSMDPVLDQGANAIEVVPTAPDQISVGDIISYENAISGGTIIHRVREIGQDEDGWFAITKGDNNPGPDPRKVRFDEVKRVVVAIVY